MACNAARVAVLRAVRAGSARGASRGFAIYLPLLGGRDLAMNALIAAASACGY